MGARNPKLHSRLAWALPALVFAAAFASFLPALSQGFVELDDDYNFTANPNWRGLSGANVRWMLTTFHLGHYQPLTWLSFALEHELWGGLKPERFHATSLALHAAASVLLYFLAVEILRAALSSRSVAREPEREARLRWCAAAAALFHAVHPLRVESAVWLTERRDVLSGCFLIGSVLAYVVRARRGGGAGLLALSLALYALSLLSKAWGLTLPAVLLALDVWPLRRLEPSARAGRALLRLAAEKLWYVPLALGSALVAGLAQGGPQAVLPLAEHGLLQRFAQACYGLVFYVRKTLWPSDLSALYLLERDLDPWRTVHVASMALAVLATVAFVLLRRRAPALLAAWLGYALIVSPVLGFLQSGAQKVADRYTYLACIPFALLAGGALYLLAERLRGPSRLALAAAAGAVLLALSGAAVAQTRVWKDSETLYRRMVEVEPDNYFARHNLSTFVWRKGPQHLSEALEHSRASVAAHPERGNEEARYFLGVLLRAGGQGEQAIQEWRECLRVAPAHEKTLRELERHELAQGDVEGALDLYRAAVADTPRFLEGFSAQARLLSRLGRAREAEAAVRAALDVAPDWAVGLQELGKLALAAGRWDDAVLLLRRAVVEVPRLGQDYATPWSSPPEANAWMSELLVDLGLAFDGQGAVGEARAQWELALRYFSGNGRARARLQQAAGGSR